MSELEIIRQYYDEKKIKGLLDFIGNSFIVVAIAFLGLLIASTFCMGGFLIVLIFSIMIYGVR